MPNLQQFLSEEPMTYITLQNVPYAEHTGHFDSICGISAIIPGGTAYSETIMDNNTLNTIKQPSLSIIEQPADTFRYRYKSEKGSHGGIKGENTARSKKSFPTVKLENCPPHLQKKVVIKVSLYTNERDPKPHVYELTGKNAGGATLDENFTAKFQQLAITTRKKEEVLEILKERKKACFDPEEYDEASVEADAQEEMKNINLDSAKLCFEAFSTDAPNTPLCKKVFSNAINNQKSAATGDLKITYLSHFSGKCSGGDKIVLLCDKVKKEDIKVRFFEEESGWEDFGEFNPAEIHHQVAIVLKTPRYHEENVPKFVYIELVRPSDGKHSEPRPFQYIPDDDHPSNRKSPNTQISRHVKNEQSEIPRKRKRVERDVEENAESSESFLKDSSVALSPSSTDDEQMPLDSRVLNALSSMDFSNIDYLEELLFPEHPEVVDILPVETQNPMDGQSKYLYESDGLSQWTKLIPQCMPFFVEADGVNEISKSMDILSIASPCAKEEVEKSEIASRCAKEEVEKSETRKESNDFVIGMKSILQNRDENSIIHYATDLISLQDENGNSMLHLGIMEQNENTNFILKMVKMSSEDVINHQNIYSETPMHLAVKGNHVNTLLLLLARGGDPNLCDRSGNNCLHLAAKHGHINCLKVLLLLPSESRRRWKHKIRDIDALNHDGMSALHLAVAGNFEDCVNFLLNRKADVNLSEKKSGRTALHLAIEHPTLLQAILKQPNVDFNAEDFGGYTAIQLACLKAGRPFEIFSEKLKDNEDLYKFLESFNQNEEECDSNCSETESDEESSDASEFEDAVEDFSPISPSEAVSITASASKLLCTNEKKTNLMKIEEELNMYLDKNDNWKKLADLIGLATQHVAVLDSGLSPGQTVIRKIKNLYPDGQAKAVIELLQLAGLEEGAHILRNNS